MLVGCTTGPTIKTELYEFKNYKNQYALIRYKGEDENFVIPEKCNGKKIIMLRFYRVNVELKSITISKNIEVIHERNHFYFSGKVVRYPKLQTINVDSNNPYFSSWNGVLYSKDKKKLYEIPYDFQPQEYHVYEDVEKIFLQHAKCSDIYLDTLRHVDIALEGTVQVKIYVSNELLEQY